MKNEPKNTAPVSPFCKNNLLLEGLALRRNHKEVIKKSIHYGVIGAGVFRVVLWQKIHSTSFEPHPNEVGKGNQPGRVGFMDTR